MWILEEAEKLEKAYQEYVNEYWDPINPFHDFSNVNAFNRPENITYGITNNIHNRVLNELENAEYSIDFSDTLIQKYLNTAINIFEEFAKNEKPFNEIARNQLRNSWLNESLDVFNKSLWTLLLMRNFCEQFDWIYKKEWWENLCNEAAPILGDLDEEHPWSFHINVNKEVWKAECVCDKNLVNVIEPRDINWDFYKVFKNIRNSIAHGKFSLIYMPWWNDLIKIDNWNFIAEVSPSFFLSWVALELNMVSWDWENISTVNINEIADVVNDRKSIDDVDINFIRFDSKKPLPFPRWAYYFWEVFPEELALYFANPEYFNEKMLSYDPFQKKLLIDLLKSNKEEFNKLEWFAQQGYIKRRFWLVWYWPSHWNWCTLFLKSLIGSLSNNWNVKISELDDNRWSKHKKILKNVWMNNNFIKLNFDNTVNIFKRLSIKAYFTKQEWPWTDNESKIRRHLRNCFIHENYTHYPSNEIWFRDHLKWDWYTETFKGNCNLDWLYNCISNWLPIYDTENFHIDVQPR